MQAEDNANQNDFNYVWRCNNAVPREEDSRTIPMREGDYLFVCVDPDGTAHFRYRKKDWRESCDLCAVTKENTELWDNASGRFDAKEGVIRGRLNKERQFTMKISREGNGYVISCNHFVNPSEGDWTGDDSWGGIV